MKELEEAVVNAAAKSLAQAKPLPNNHTTTESEIVEMHVLKIHESAKAAVKPSDTSESIAANIAITHATTPTTTTPPTNNVPETKTTNTANATDNLCVSHSPPSHRQQHRQNQNPENQQGTSISPANNQQHQKIAHSPLAKNSAIPLHRRSSDSDLSITPKGRFYLKVSVLSLD